MLFRGPWITCITVKDTNRATLQMVRLFQLWYLGSYLEECKRPVIVCPLSSNVTPRRYAYMAILARFLLFLWTLPCCLSEWESQIYATFRSRGGTDSLWRAAAPYLECAGIPNMKIYHSAISYINSTCKDHQYFSVKEKWQLKSVHKNFKSKVKLIAHHSDVTVDKHKHVA